MSALLQKTKWVILSIVLLAVLAPVAAFCQPPTASQGAQAPPPPTPVPVPFYQISDYEKGASVRCGEVRQITTYSGIGSSGTSGTNGGKVIQLVVLCSSANYDDYWFVDLDKQTMVGMRVPAPR